MRVALIIICIVIFVFLLRLGDAEQKIREHDTAITLLEKYADKLATAYKEDRDK